MFDRDLVYIDSFESDFKGKKYKIYNFVDESTLQVIRGTDLGVDLDPNATYTCKLDLKGGKLKVVEII